MFIPWHIFFGIHCTNLASEEHSSCYKYYRESSHKQTLLECMEHYTTHQSQYRKVVACSMVLHPTFPSCATTKSSDTLLAKFFGVLPQGSSKTKEESKSFKVCWQQLTGNKVFLWGWVNAEFVFEFRWWLLVELSACVCLHSFNCTYFEILRKEYFAPFAVVTLPIFNNLLVSYLQKTSSTFQTGGRKRKHKSANNCRWILRKI